MTANAFPERRAAFPETVPPRRCGVKQGVSATGKITAPAPSLGAGEGRRVRRLRGGFTQLAASSLTIATAS
ncbi:hypothetical protein GCM10029978_113690 [Actinoallomurus acanthiterrae]